jgi:ornithine cyclodeaminase/alanine dehydrogenase-like protein (mu-crystallin family)
MAEETKPKAPYDALIPEGAFKKEDLTELGDVLTGKASPRRSPSDRVLYELTGGNFHDLFVATWGYEWARSQGIGHSFDVRSGATEVG